ncbi:carbohydrate ABC transporter permease [Streptomyces caniscabiei]|uniref:Sugar ABC transporter permease n=1 Tax=Streptomyces caniscabiei TaxID=2746961 RepID=A0ABU4N5V9_9ACTN|nr:ABC transporter permease subunit [Streptomyces caniscabiei]MBE4741222.1 sugar ABC transporter permease [Streptomyces caniscabiei]MBE4760873.1 sugar ABC transporter permease [Streptomyces caniscabiei]MBE4774856.1 sugar ABC transporter permease [Streptomyces caniscabiei]MBE4789615.1 sugar ABC transporter permease [Streptomyces caniscabiei]MBE4798716.1 sugar ABC transporter permease [Streptomyces caniscabiei]
MSTEQITAPGAPSPSGETAARPGPRTGAHAGRGPRSLTTRRAWSFYVFAGPWLLGFLALTAFPLGYALWLSLTNSDGLSNNSRFVGLDNYRQVLSDPETLSSLARTGVFTAITVPLTIVAGILLAVLVNQPIRARGLFRTLLYLPAIVPPVGAALTFKLIFDRDSGAANGALDALNIDGVSWLMDPYARWVLVTLTLWGAGNCMIISLAGLQDIPKEMHEAARVDGANAWQSFTRITLPLLSPVLFFQVITGIIAAVQSFLPLLISLDPTPRGVSAVPEGNSLFMIQVFAQYFANGRYGYASAMLWVLFLIIVAVTFLVFRLSRGAVFYSVAPEAAKPSKPRTIGGK